MAEVKEIHQGWVRVIQGQVGVTISPRGILHPTKAFHGDEEDLIACLWVARRYIKEHLTTYKKRGVPW